jgi:hypothetical protein
VLWALILISALHEKRPSRYFFQGGVFFISCRSENRWAATNRIWLLTQQPGLALLRACRVVLRRTILIFEKAPGSRYPDLGQSLTNLGLVGRRLLRAHLGLIMAQRSPCWRITLIFRQSIPYPNLRPVLRPWRSQGGGEGRFALGANYNGASCCSTYCLRTDRGAPPQLMMQYDLDHSIGLRR